MLKHSTPWPALPLEEWKETCATLHMYTQIAGKVRLEFTPACNHLWQVPLYLTARGLTTSPIPYRDRTFELLFDFIDHRLLLHTSDGDIRYIPLGGSVKHFYSRALALLHDARIDAHIWPHPVEVPNPIPFDQDETHATYDPEQAHRFWDVLRRIDMVFKQFRSGFTGKCSPVHFFWGSFDLAVTRFSGRPAPPRPDADPITRASYNAELSSLGFWPGGQGVDASFYSYAFPQPAAFPTQAVLPASSAYNEKIGEFLLPYEAVRTSPDPAAAILDFAQSTYEAAARLQNWPPNLTDPPLTRKDSLPATKSLS